jgi:hypothetical protein
MIVWQKDVLTGAPAAGHAPQNEPLRKAGRRLRKREPARAAAHIQPTITGMTRVVSIQHDGEGKEIAAGR